MDTKCMSRVSGERFFRDYRGSSGAGNGNHAFGRGYGLTPLTRLKSNHSYSRSAAIGSVPAARRDGT